MRCKALTTLNGSKPLCHSVWLAEQAHQRLRGLLFRPALQAGEGLLLWNVRSIHTIGMRYPIDVVFLDESLKITGCEAQVGSRRVLFGGKGARHALELRAGTLQQEVWAVGNGLLLRPRSDLQ